MEGPPQIDTNSGLSVWLRLKPPPKQGTLGEKNKKQTRTHALRGFSLQVANQHFRPQFRSSKLWVKWTLPIKPFPRKKEEQQTKTPDGFWGSSWRHTSASAAFLAFGGLINSSKESSNSSQKCTEGYSTHLSGSYLSISEPDTWEVLVWTICPKESSMLIVGRQLGFVPQKPIQLCWALLSEPKWG